MNPVVIIIGIIFSTVSCAVLAYTSIATTIGPWIAPTIILSSLLTSKLLAKMRLKSLSTKDIILIQGISAGGGIIATGFGFALPMLYFLDTATFNKWMNHPFYFFCLVGSICIASGSLGLCMGRILSKVFVDRNSLPFPVSQLTYNVATTDQNKQTKSLFSGVFSTLTLLILRDGIGSWGGVFPKIIYFFPSIFREELCFSFMPMFWAIGSSMGLSIVLPFLVGMVSKYLVVYPINNHSLYLPFTLFQPHKPIVAIFAFCSGILICDFIYSIPKPHELTERFCALKKWLKSSLYNPLTLFDKKKIGIARKKPINSVTSAIIYMEPIITISLSLFLLNYFNFSILAQITLLILTIIATYHICLISGEIGLLQLGRFATFVMIPMYFFFNLNFVQITICCVFFNVCAATASDFLFDYKTGLLCGISKTKTHKYQLLGLSVSASCLGLFFWLLFTNFEIGSPELFAQKAQGKAALLQTFKFDPYIVVCGFAFASILKKLKISPAATFGGLIMPNNITLSLFLGSLTPMFFKNKSNLQFFCAGTFSSESIWVFACIIGKIFG